ncbi:hypothetical protein ACXET9_14045 [Brachybacterium sp. DNPG3]
MAQIFARRHGRPAAYDEARDRVAPLANRVAERALEAGSGPTATLPRCPSRP